MEPWQPACFSLRPGVDSREVRGTMPTREQVKTTDIRTEIRTTARSANAAHPHSVGSYGAEGTRARTMGTGVGPRFTAEESILLQNLATGNTIKEMAGQLRLPRESLYRLLGDLRRKTGAADDTALAVWVLRNMGSSDRRGCER
jgi:DNA-binding NarL/FixJ family response regulator